MKQRSQAALSAMIGVWLTAPAGAVIAPDMGKTLTFDRAGRVTLVGEAASLTDPLKEGGPPGVPPNIQCPC